MTMTDHAHTRKATANRQAKANRLALAASERGYQAYELAIAGSTLANEKRREQVRKDCGIQRRPSDETWSLALEVLVARGLEVCGGARCIACEAPVRRVKAMSGAMLDVDPFAHPLGRVVPSVKDGKTLAIVYAGHDTLPDDLPRFRQHQRTCPTSPAGRALRLREAPKCPVCNEALDPELAYSYPAYRTHPCCDPYPQER